MLIHCNSEDDLLLDEGVLKRERCTQASRAILVQAAAMGCCLCKFRNKILYYNHTTNRARDCNS
jgi:hypothetical protein